MNCCYAGRLRYLRLLWIAIGLLEAGRRVLDSCLLWLQTWLTKLLLLRLISGEMRL